MNKGDFAENQYEMLKQEILDDMSMEHATHKKRLILDVFTSSPTMTAAEFEKLVEEKLMHAELDLNRDGRLRWHVKDVEVLVREISEVMKPNKKKVFAGWDKGGKSEQKTFVAQVPTDDPADPFFNPKGTVNHPFVATPNNGKCSSCGRSRNHQIHENP